MTLDERTEIIDKISRTIAILQCDMKLHQSMNIFSMNIHAEDFYCNVFNFLYADKHFENANQASKNESYIDLVDHNSKHFIQITTSTAKEKIDNTLKILETKEVDYTSYQIDIFYLFDKPKRITKETIEIYNQKYGINDIRKNLKDFTDLLNDIKHLSDDRLNKIYDLYFKESTEQITEEIALQIVFESLIKDNHAKKINYSSDFNTINLDEKISINKLNRRVSNELYTGSEAALPIYEEIDGSIIEELRALVVEGLYSKILKQHLTNEGTPKKEISNKTVEELHNIAQKKGLNFSAILGELSHQLTEKTFKANYQEKSMAWIIISYFFEECDIGLKQ